MNWMVELWPPVAMPSAPGDVEMTGPFVPGVVAVAVIVPGSVEDTVTLHVPGVQAKQAQQRSSNSSSSSSGS
jgi:hypothetical protein